MERWVTMTTYSTRRPAPPLSKKEAGDSLHFHSFANDALRAMTLIEIMIVMAIIAVTLAVVVPQFNFYTGSDAATKLTRLQSDIKSAYDLALLNGQTLRFVFELESGDYRLEVADRMNVILSDDRVNYDLLEDQEKDRREAFDQQFKEFKELLGDSVYHPETEKKIPQTSPVLRAENDLKPIEWTVVKDQELSGKRSLGPNLMIFEMQAEHHANKQILSELPEKGRGFIYVFPDGRVERSYLKIAYKKGGREVDESQAPYTLIIDSYTGTSSLISGNVDVDIREKRE